jgi:hypothetical protein
MNFNGGGGGNSPQRNETNTYSSALDAVLNIIDGHLGDGFAEKNPDLIADLLIAYYRMFC